MSVLHTKLYTLAMRQHNRNILLSLGFLLIPFFQALWAQETSKSLPSAPKEVLFAYGIAPFPIFFHFEDKTSPEGGIFSFRDPNIRNYRFVEQGSYSLGFSWKKRKKRFRLIVNHTRFRVEETFFGGDMQEEKHRYTSILADWTRTWWNKKNMELYSGGGIGLGFNQVSFVDPRLEALDFTETRIHLPFNITLIGFRYNFEKFSGFLDLGWGDLGTVTTGLSLPLN